MAQLDSASDSDSEGRRFESYRVGQKSTSFDRSLSIFTSSLLTLHFSLFSFETCRLGTRRCRDYERTNLNQIHHLRLFLLKIVYISRIELYNIFVLKNRKKTAGGEKQ